MIALALSTQIPMSEWEAAGDRAMATAWELLKEAEAEVKAKVAAAQTRTETEVAGNG